MYELKKIGKVFTSKFLEPDPRLMKFVGTGPSYYEICWDRALVLWNLLGPGPRIMKFVGTGPSYYEICWDRALVLWNLLGPGPRIMKFVGTGPSYYEICWDRALVLWKKDLPGFGLTKFEKHWSRVYRVCSAVRIFPLHFFHHDFFSWKVWSNIPAPDWKNRGIWFNSSPNLELNTGLLK